jgi:hypothetical protein
MRKLLFFGLCALISCEEKYDELSGHWVSKGYFQGKEFQTIDFEQEFFPSGDNERDTFNYYIYFNKNSLAGGGGSMSFVAKADNGYEFYTSHYDDTMKITFTDDTLFVRGVGNDSYDGEFIRVEKSAAIYKELFNGTEIIGRLPNRKKGDVMLDVIRSLITNINIGKGKYDPVDSDSIRINVWDAYISLSDVTSLVLRQKDALPETWRQNLIICLNADSSVNNSFLLSIRDEVLKADSVLRIYRATFDYPAEKIYYRSLN